MKGFIEYLIASNEEFERELERDSNHTEVPYLKENYQQWLAEQGVDEENIGKELEHLHLIDHDIFLFEEDFFELLRTAVEEKNAKLAEKYFAKYGKLIDDYLQAAADKEIEETEETVGEWKKSFERYRMFILREKMDFFVLPYQEDFIQWFSKGTLKSTARQYVNHIERLYNEVLRNTDYAQVFDSIDQLAPPSAKDIVAQLEQTELFLKSNTTRKTAEAVMKADSFSNCNTAFHYYLEYMKFRLLGKTTISRAARNNRPKIYYREEIMAHFLDQLYKMEFMREKQYKIYFSLPLVRKILKKRDALAKDSFSYANGLVGLLKGFLGNTMLREASHQGNTTECFRLYQIESMTIYPKEKVTVQFEHDDFGTIVCHDEEVDPMTDYGYENGILLDQPSGNNRSSFEISQLSELSVSFSNEMFKYKQSYLSAFRELTEIIKEDSETEVQERIPAEFINEWAKDLLLEISTIFAKQDLEIIYTSEYKMMNE